MPSISRGQRKRIVRSRLRQPPLADQAAEGARDLEDRRRSRWHCRWRPARDDRDGRKRRSRARGRGRGSPRSGSDSCPAVWPASTSARRWTVSPRASRSCQAWARAGETMKAKVGSVAKVSRWPQRIRLSSSPHQPVRWFCAQETMPAAPKLGRPRAAATAPGCAEARTSSPRTLLAGIVGLRVPAPTSTRSASARPADAVLGEADRLLVPGGDPLGIGPLAIDALPFPELGEAGVPARAASAGCHKDRVPSAGSEMISTSSRPSAAKWSRIISAAAR